MLLLVSSATQEMHLSGVKTLPFSFSSPIPTADAVLPVIWEVSAHLQKRLFSVLMYQWYGFFGFAPTQELLVFSRFNDTFV